MRHSITTFALLITMALPVAANSASNQLAELPSELTPSDILIDRVLQLSAIEELSGDSQSPTISTSHWRQVLHEISRAAGSPAPWQRSGLDARLAARPGAPVPVAILDLEYQRLDPRTLAEDGSIDLSMVATLDRRLFSAAALRNRTHRGQSEQFRLDSRWYLSQKARPEFVEIDFDDGLGYRPIRFDQTVRVNYPSAGQKTLRLRHGQQLASFQFEVVALATPSPNDTLQITSTIPYNSEFGSGEAYVYLAAGHTALTQPAVVIEGFDIDDSLNWDELYELLNQENLLEDLRSDGFDAVVLNFTSATDHLQKNSMVVVELLQQIQAVTPGTPLALVGASMGALCSRYALSYMEDQSIPHSVQNFISFDGPQAGANIPLGVQHWVNFFESQSEDAAFLLSRLNSPAARQLLLLHHTQTSASTASADPLRAQFEADLNALGSYPQQPRLVAVSNGSGSMQDQGFAPATQVVEYDYNAGLVNLVGNVWALGDGPLTTVFDGTIFIIFVSNENETISVSNTMPWDGAPGGWRSSMADMDSTEAPFGDIIALHPNHCFIPTISALDLATTDPFFDFSTAGDLLSLSPFDALYFPAANQGHVDVTAENKQWLIDEIRGIRTGAPAAAVIGPTRVLPSIPNPFNPTTSLRFVLSQRERVTLDLYDSRGRRIERLLAGVELDAGTHAIPWRPEGLASGVYRFRLQTEHDTRSGRVVLVK